MIPKLLVGSLSIAIVRLGAGCQHQTGVPQSRWFQVELVARLPRAGVGNMAGAFVQAAPSGGSLSRTAVIADGGARPRIGGYVAALTVVLLVVLFGPVVGRSPVPSSGACCW